MRSHLLTGTSQRVAGSVAALAAATLVLSFGPPAAAAPAPLTGFLQTSGEQPGFTVNGTPTTVTSADSFVQGGSFSAQERAAALASFKKAGFKKAVFVGTKGSGGRQGFTLVMQFKNPAGARTGAAVILHLAGLNSGPKPKSLTVPGVSSARGETQVSKTAGAVNVYWTVGSCALGSGLLNPAVKGASAAKVAAPVVTGVKAQHARLGATCP